MLAVGATVINPRTGTEFELLEMSEKGFVLRSTIPGNMTIPDFEAHVHHGWQEEIVVHSGQGTYIKGGVRGEARGGDSITFPERVPHTHPWNTGSEPLVMDQIATLDPPPHPRAVHDTLGILFTANEWIAANKMATTPGGLPKNPLKLAATVRLLARGGSYDVRFPTWVQDLIGATLGRLAMALGVDMVDPKYK